MFANQTLICDAKRICIPQQNLSGLSFSEDLWHHTYSFQCFKILSTLSVLTVLWHFPSTYLPFLLILLSESLSKPITAHPSFLIFRCLPSYPIAPSPPPPSSSLLIHKLRQNSGITHTHPAPQHPTLMFDAVKSAEITEERLSAYLCICGGAENWGGTAHQRSSFMHPWSIRHRPRFLYLSLGCSIWILSSNRSVHLFWNTNG